MIVGDMVNCPEMTWPGLIVPLIVVCGITVPFCRRLIVRLKSVVFARSVPFTNHMKLFMFAESGRNILMAEPSWKQLAPGIPIRQKLPHFSSLFAFPTVPEEELI